ncbi:MAG TPA: MBL fold metallo-hydrolase [Deltaproteobacteria bacterium]|nr:MBL fold metallo-hydrolase [Deltaproteobacteria bacterium]HPR55569.1 MBL fold metallo-hydrolase [Deltaproteobacteria bacterium]HXK46016.1 MBL fold metallo-hydrolase [Deltaproteobacteria bacterium]
MDGIRVLTVPLPGFPALICSNMFVVGKGPVTLIDSAPRFPGSFAAVDRQLSETGFTWNDVERIIITHGHIDHFGLVGMIRRAAASDIPCHIHEDDIWRLSGEYLRGGMWSEEADLFYARVGMPADVVQRMKRRSHFFKNLCDPVDDAIPMRDGDVFTGSGFDLTVIHTPGHSTGCCCLYESRRRILFSGDHLLRHITPNPFHEVNRSRLKDSGYKSLKAYLASLDRLEPLDIASVFPSHGESFDDIGGLMEGYRAHHAGRTESVLHAVRRGPRTIYGLVDELFPDIADSEAFLAVSEILVHLELLLEDGRAELVDHGPPERYAAP